MKPSTRVSRSRGWHLGSAGVLLALTLLFLSDAGPLSAAGVDGYNGYVADMVVTPERPATVYVITRWRETHWQTSGFEHWGIYKSRDGGRSWSAVDMSGLPSPERGDSSNERRGLAVDYNNSATLYVATSGHYDPDLGRYSDGLYRSVDGGLWQRVGEPISLSAVAVDFRDPNVLYGFKTEQAYGPCQPGKFIRSRDGGLTWEELGSRAASMRKILIDPRNPSRLYAEELCIGRGGPNSGPRILRGDDQGNWVEIPPPTEMWPGRGMSPGGLAFDPATGALYTGAQMQFGVYAPAEGLGLFKTLNPEEATPQWQRVASFATGPWGREALPLALGGNGGLNLYLQTMGLDTGLWASVDGGPWKLRPIPTGRREPGTLPPGYTFPETGKNVSGWWWDFLVNHGSTDNLGYPRTEVIADPMSGGQTVQYFQRLVLEWHPENPPAFRIQRRLLGDLLYPGAAPPLDPNDPRYRPPCDSAYFPFSPNEPTGLGHYLANCTADSQPTYFKEYFDSHGGVDAFGYPKEEPRWRNGLWTQRFQAAVFEYHPENDRDGNVPGTEVPYRNFRVLLELLGDEYIAQNYLPYID